MGLSHGPWLFGRSVMRLRLVSVVETRSLTRWQCSPSPLGHYGSVSTTYLGRAEAQLFVFLTFQGFQVIPRYQVAGLDWQGVQPLFQQFSALVMEASIRRRSPIQIYDDENHVMSLRGGRVRVHAKTGVAPSPQGSPSKRCSAPSRPVSRTLLWADYVAVALRWCSHSRTATAIASCRNAPS